MKTYKFLLPLIIAVSLVTSSCMDDNSTSVTQEIKGVVIDTTGMSSFNILRFDTLNVTPNVLTEMDTSRLSYEWKITLDPLDKHSYQIIGHQRKLIYKVDLLPNNIREYTLLLTVTDTETGLKYLMPWPLQVVNIFREGLVVASTTDGSTTDLGLIMSPRVTQDLNNVRVKHHVYSSANDINIKGLVKDMQYFDLNGKEVLLAITDRSIIRVAKLDYKLEGKNQDLFHYHPAPFNPEMVATASGSRVYVENGTMTITSDNTLKLGIPKEAPYTIPEIIAIKNKASFSSYPVQFSFYDEDHGYFVYLPSIHAQYDDKMHQTSANQNGAFNPAKVPNKLNVAAAGHVVERSQADGDFAHLLKDKTTGEYALYVLSGGEKERIPGGAYKITSPAPKALYDLSGAPEIQNAHKFVLADNQKVLYYATDRKIYAVIYGTNTPVYELRYTAPAGETITTLQLYYQAGYKVYENGRLTTNGKQLIMSTYDGSEGKVYLLPISNLGVGLIDEANIVSFSGFGKITAITPQE